MKLNAAFSLLARILHDYLTSDDGQTFAIGRGMALGMMTVVILMPPCIAVWAAITLKPSLAEWGIFLPGVGGFYVTSCGGVMALVWGTKPTEPKAPPCDPEPDRPEMRGRF